jgi:uncharacterized protein YcbX
MGRIARIATAPVKGLALTHPTEVILGPDGVPENRRFYLVAEDGRHRSGLAFGPLATIVPDYDPVAERLAMTFPDGRRIEGDACALDAGIEVPWGSSLLTGHVLAGPWSASLSAFVGMNLQVVRADPGQHPQSRPVSIVSQASIDELERSADLPGPLDDRRFRMLFTVDRVEPRDEDGWVGREVAIGDAVVRVELTVPRCATTTRDPETGARDWDALRAVRALRGLSVEQTVDFGVYATVVKTGRVAIGDAAGPN